MWAVKTNGRVIAHLTTYERAEFYAEQIGGEVVLLDCTCGKEHKA